MVAGSVKKLISLNKGLCHYCGNKTSVRSHVNDKYPTKDHIVPRAFGGANDISNYVLACARCNNKRGTTLFYCDCQDCNEKILDALYDPDTLNFIFSGIVKHNKPRIFKHEISNGKDWAVVIGAHRRNFYTYDEAVTFALTDSCVKDKDYGQD